MEVQDARIGSNAFAATLGTQPKTFGLSRMQGGRSS